MIHSIEGVEIHSVKFLLFLFNGIKGESNIIHKTIAMGRKRRRNHWRRQWKSITQIKQDISVNENSLKKGYIKNKYKEILGSKEPIVLLKKLPIKEILLPRLINQNSQNNIIKQNYEQKPEHSNQKLNSVKPMPHTPDTSRSKNLSSSWGILHDTDLKEKALKNDTKLKICLNKIKLCDRNLNVISPSDKLKTVHKNDLKQKVQHTQVGRKPKTIINNKFKSKQNQKTYRNLDINENESLHGSSFFNFDSLSHSDVDLSDRIFVKNYIMNRYLADLERSSTLNNIVKETNECCMNSEKENLSLKNVEKDVTNSVCDTLDQNVKKVKKLPTIIREDILPKYSVKLRLSKQEVNQPCNEGAKFHSNDISNEINFQDSGCSTVVPKKSNITHITECLEINKKQSLNLKRKFVIPKMQKKNADFDKDDKEVDKENNKNTLFYKNTLTDLFKQNCLNFDQDTNSQPSKKIKLDNNKWLQNSINFELNNNGIIPQMTTSSGLNNVELNSEEVVTEIDETKSKTDKGIPDFMKQNQIESVVGIQDCNSLQNTKEPEEVASNACELPKKKQYPTSVEEDDDDDDRISLFADSEIIKEYGCSTPSPAHEKPYYMTDKSFDNYYKSNKSEFNEMYENNNVSNTTNEIKFQPRLKSTNSRKNTVNQNYLLRTVFAGSCYKMIQTGTCYNNMCQFSHGFLYTMNLLYRNEEQTFFLVLEELVSNGHIRFIQRIFKELAHNCASDIFYVIKIAKRLFELNSITNEITTDITQCLRTTRRSLNIISDRLATLVNEYDFKFINWILSISQSFIEFGTYWDTFRSLLLKTTYLEPRIVEIILQECIVTRRHLRDININIICKLETNVYSKINEQLLLNFNNLIKCNENNSGIKQNVTAETKTLQQKDISSKTNKEDNNNNNNKNTGNDQNVIIRVNTNFETVHKTPISFEANNEDAENGNTSLTLHPIDGLAEPSSALGRRKFFPFYQEVHRLQEGLENNDYDRVMKILNSVQKNQGTLFANACYQILSKKIIRSHHHLSKLIPYTVRTGATKVLYKILLEVAISILAHLTAENYWVLAYTLLKNVYVLLKYKINVHRLDATTIMLFAEIYLANQQPIKALKLLKQSNIILSCRSQWNVRSTEQDSYLRTQVISLLLDELCELFPEHGFTLFRILITEQFSNFYPIDLASFANKIVSVLIQKEYYEYVIDAGILVDDQSFTLNTITFRALIAILVNLDMQLAKQLYRKAMNLGIYSRPRFQPITFLIIDSDWTSEEMYLGIFNLMKQLLLNIGHAIERVSPRQLSVYLIFESIPLENQLNYDTGKNQCNKTVEASRLLMQQMLKQKFDPPILMMKTNKDKVCRLNNKSVLAYLQTEHYE
ncbi:reticulocyte-binding protein homolog 1-like isoform X2 [Osmia bicornis bicornis]|uniref:reticulocyte-binding protein homolog 1-like isoform X2 n=1 Tax=Osmia bicornis bicornis TaxID=1437191 RepID=UPI001EAF1128|nr:reticulocyte-binding protein homolog 1-like isoform X2 [Osmia bicornis bicornis]